MSQALQFCYILFCFPFSRYVLQNLQSVPSQSSPSSSVDEIERLQSENAFLSGELKRMQRLYYDTLYILQQANVRGSSRIVILRRACVGANILSAEGFFCRPS